MSWISDESLKSILYNVAVKYNLKDWCCNVAHFESKAQNFFGTLIPVTLEGTRHGSVENIPLVLKLAPRDERYRISGAISIFFQREIFMYDFALEVYKDIQATIPSSNYVIPKCYYTCDKQCEEVIVLQDMRVDGFRPHVHAEFLDLKHLQLAMISLAELHALSFIVKSRDAESYQRMTTECPPLNGHTNKRFMDIMKDRLKRGKDKFADTRYADVFELLLEFCDKLFALVTNFVSNTCVCHGDLWKENIMFKYDESDDPVAACVIDYQTCRVSSPAFDVVYLLLSSSDTQLRCASAQTLKQLYHQTLSQLLTEAGLDAAEVYSGAMFERDCEMVTPACAIVANTALWLASGMQQEGHVRSKQVLKTDTEMAAAVAKYKELLEGIVSEDLWTANIVDSLRVAST